ncbi:MAG: hypothetical protein DWH81_14695 [Planctomycetota bacterium]|nr:MAG: hypothetical protein DWH81_14695 [Planctomycetota bacterium]
MKKLPKPVKKAGHPGEPELPQAVPALAGWTFLANDSHVHLCLYYQPGRRLRQFLLEVGIFRRAVQRIVAELADAGFLPSQKEGRCHRYTFNDSLQ